MTCAPSEDSDQPGHPQCLIRVFAVRMKKAWVLKLPTERTAKTDWTGRMPRLISVFAGRTVILLVLSWCGSNINSSVTGVAHQSLFKKWSGYRIKRILLLLKRNKNVTKKGVVLNESGELRVQWRRSHGCCLCHGGCCCSFITISLLYQFTQILMQTLQYSQILVRCNLPPYLQLWNNMTCPKYCLLCAIYYVVDAQPLWKLAGEVHYSQKSCKPEIIQKSIPGGIYFNLGCMPNQDHLTHFGPHKSMRWSESGRIVICKQNSWGVWARTAAAEKEILI